jgi:hypothetical protein
MEKSKARQRSSFRFFSKMRCIDEKYCISLFHGRRIIATTTFYGRNHAIATRRTKKKGIGSKAESSSCHCPNKQYLDRYMFTSPIAMQSIIAK